MSAKPDHFWNFIFFDSIEKAASALTKEIITKTEKTIQQKGRSVWAVSGGSSILRLYDALLEHKEKIIEFGERLTVIWVDERVVPHSHERSNYGNACDYFWNLFERVKLVPVPYSPVPEQAAIQYNSILRENGIDKGGIDVNILGMGTDGHTASLFPKNMVLNEKEKDIVSVIDPSVEDPRITMTFPFINSSEAIYLFFYGSEKAETLKQASLSGKVEQYPILGINRNKLVIYSNQDLGY